MAIDFNILYINGTPEEKKALSIASSQLCSYTDICHSCIEAAEFREDIRKGDCMILGTEKTNPYVARLSRDGYISPCDRPEGFTVKFMPNPYCSGKYILAVASKNDPRGVLYGTAELFYNVLPDKKNRHNHCPYFYELFKKDVPEPFEYTSSPACKHRGLWTWGHVIFDYKRYIDRMVTMKMNSLVIWNDYPPVNLKEVIDYAHSCGINIYAGYAWGWDNTKIHLSKEILSQLRVKIVKEYQEKYQNYELDGIYFQSFTETTKDELDGLNIAQEVTELVNDVSAVLLEKEPELKLLFGLHATSVRNKLDIIKRVDKRVYIIWEDMGAFPFAYVPQRVENFDKTDSFTKTIATLRGTDDRFGAVTKGLVCLDWIKFIHQKGPYVMGEATPEYVKRRFETKKDIWKYTSAYWLKNLSFAKKGIASMLKANSESFIVGLVEDALIEEALPLPVALYGELLWDPEADEGELLTKCAQREDVYSI
ncbi:MAG: hypothetical protein E7646_07150 [Ruminococcaceae bacterium]|nr:hypothetical protein [Oscillospiraceae bacterium]